MKTVVRLLSSLLLVIPRNGLKMYSTRRELIMRKEKVHFETKEKNIYKPKNENQKQYFNYLNDLNSTIILAIGPAGTGKTLLACDSAIKQLKSGVFDKIIITRPAVSVEEEEMGFLPGNIVDKMDPWTRPVIDIFSEFYTRMEIRKMIENSIIEIAPLAFMRGRTFKNAFIIADEMQNSSPNQMLMLTTRIGTSSKMVITGDLNQSDKKDPLKLNGLADIINKHKKFSKQNTGIKLIEMLNSDIERNPIIITLMEMYDIKSNKDTTTLIPPVVVQQHNQSFSVNKQKIDDAALIPIKDMQRIVNLLPPNEKR